MHQRFRGAEERTEAGLHGLVRRHCRHRRRSKVQEVGFDCERYLNGLLSTVDVSSTLRRFRFETEDNDDYSSIMLKALADRLAEVGSLAAVSVLWNFVL